MSQFLSFQTNHLAFILVENRIELLKLDGWHMLHFQMHDINVKTAEMS